MAKGDTHYGPDDVRFTLDNAIAKCLERVQHHRPLTPAEVMLVRFLIRDLGHEIGVRVELDGAP